MADVDLSSMPRFESIISDAVDRQVSEQRALQDALSSVQSGFAELRETIEAAAADVQGLAQAILDLNSGLQESYRSMEARIGTLATSLLEGLKDLAGTQQEALESLGKAVSSSTSQATRELGETLRGGVSSLGARIDDLHQGYAESSEITAYLRDQADDLDRILAALGDVPRKLEGVVAQALRRALTVRAGLIREAEKALDRSLAPVENRVRELTRELGATRRSAAGKGKADPLADDIHHIADVQAEIVARLEAIGTREPVEPAPKPSRAARTATSAEKTARSARTATRATKTATRQVAKKPRSRTPRKEPAKKEAKNTEQRPRARPKLRTGSGTEEPAPKAPRSRGRRRNYIPV